MCIGGYWPGSLKYNASLSVIYTKRIRELSINNKMVFATLMSGTNLL